MRRHGATFNVLVTVAEEKKVKCWRRGVESKFFSVGFLVFFIGAELCCAWRIRIEERNRIADGGE
jgi:hypothetical protein